MKHIGLAVALVLASAPAVWAQGAATTQPATTQPVTTQPATTQPATTQPASATKPAEKPKDPKLAKAEEIYNQIVAAYMSAKWPELVEKCKAVARHTRYLNRQQRQDVIYIRKAAAGYRPSWWKATKSPSNASFRAAIWNRPFMANYIPSSTLGVQQAYYDYETNQITIIVSWRPEMVDNPKPAGGGLAKLHGMTKGDLGEVIVWHELGHNYITKFLPVAHVLELYRNHSMLFYHLQEFYADLTAVYHCSPRARRAALMIRLDSMRRNAEGEEHNRAAQAIGALLIANFLAAPDKWPSVHFPPEVPKEDPERKTIIYVYEHFDPKWTLVEDRQLRKIIEDFVRTKGELTLRRRGEVMLPNKLSFKLITAQDREQQVKRDAWVTEKLQAIIKSGRADKPPKKGEKESPFDNRIEIPYY